MIKRYVATADSTITNAYKYDLTTRATGSNTGKSDIIEVFSLYGQAGTGSAEIELSRILLNFPIDEISDDITASILPNTTQYVLRLFNAPHSQTLPENFTLIAQAISQSWIEGTGLDMETYLDTGDVTWVSASNGVSWASPGGDYTGVQYSQSFDTGEEDLEIDITSLVASWISGSLNNYGIGIRLSSSFETQLSSTYTKKFFARGTEFFFKKPVIEARFDDSIQDQRGSFYASSSMIPDNTNKIFLYNNVRGTLTNIPGIDSVGDQIYVNLYDSRSGGNQINTTTITGGWNNVGVYSASIEVDTTSSYVYDRWYNSGLTICYFTGSIRVKNPNEMLTEERISYVVQPSGFKTEYDSEENTRFKFVSRKKNWLPTTYTVHQRTNADYESLNNAYYRVLRVSDNYEVIPFGTGSIIYTKLSSNVSGNYCNFDMSLLEPGYLYGIQIGYYDGNNFNIVPQTFNFRVR